MSYKFDSPFMSIALISPIIPFLFLKKKVTFFIVSILCILITLNTYQAGNSVYIILSMYIIFLMIIKNNDIKNIYKYFLICACAYICSLFLYKILFVTTDMEITFNIIKNIEKCLFIYKEVILKTTFGYLLPILIFIFILSSCHISRISNFQTIVFNLIFITLSVLLSQGSYLILKIFPLSPRVFNSIGILIGIISIFGLKINNKILLFIAKFTIIFSAYFLIIQSSSCANALNNNRNFLSNKIIMAMSDLNKMTKHGDTFKVHIICKTITKNSPVLNSTKSFPIINHIVIHYNNNWWMNGIIYKKFGFKGKYSKDICSNKNNKIIQTVDTSMHKITKYDNNCFIVEFK